MSEQPNHTNEAAAAIAEAQSLLHSAPDEGRVYWLGGHPVGDTTGEHGSWYGYGLSGADLADVLEAVPAGEPAYSESNAALDTFDDDELAALPRPYQPKPEAIADVLALMRSGCSD
jgi:hypothetical protein